MRTLSAAVAALLLLVAAATAAARSGVFTAAPGPAAVEVATDAAGVAPVLPSASPEVPSETVEAVPSPSPLLTTPSDAPPVPPSREALRSQLAEAVSRPDLAVDGQVGIAVLDEHGREVYGVRADRPVLPASTAKLVTAAAALLAYGPDHRFTTTVRAEEPPTPGGTLVGDLVLVGAGDPSLATPEYGRYIYPARPRTPLEALADAVAASGVQRILGDVVGEGSAFPGPRAAPGWKAEYFSDFDARPVTGLTVDAGLRWWVERPAPELELALHVADDPVAESAGALHRLLRERGITIEGTARAAEVPVDAPVQLGAVDSPPLEQMLRHTVQRSDNHMADTLFLVLGATDPRGGTWASAAAAVRDLLDPLGANGQRFSFRDGSGLSRDDRLTARFLAELDTAMSAGPHADVWRSLMAVAGESGTLRSRLKGTLAQGRFLGKTGTLDDVRAVAGSVVGSDGRRYHLAVVGNDLTGGDRWRVRVLMDELVLLLAADLEGCQVAPPSPAPSPSADPRNSTVVCAGT